MRFKSIKTGELVIANSPEIIEFFSSNNDYKKLEDTKKEIVEEKVEIEEPIKPIKTFTKRQFKK